MAAGIPVVASDVGGVAEIVGDDAGILVPAGDAAALAGAIDALAADSDRRLWMGKAARERFDERFEAGAWVETLRDLYDRIISGGF